MIKQSLFRYLYKCMAKSLQIISLNILYPHDIFISKNSGLPFKIKLAMTLEAQVFLNKQIIQIFCGNELLFSLEKRFRRNSLGQLRSCLLKRILKNNYGLPWSGLFCLVIVLNSQWKSQNTFSSLLFLFVKRS